MFNVQFNPIQFSEKSSIDYPCSVAGKYFSAKFRRRSSAFVMGNWQTYQMKEKVNTDVLPLPFFSHVNLNFNIV